VYSGTAARKSTIVLFRQLKSMTFISFVHTSYLYLRLIFNFVPRASGQIDLREITCEVLFNSPEGKGADQVVRNMPL